MQPRSGLEYHDELIDAVQRVFAHVLGLEAERPGTVTVDEEALQQFVFEVLGAPGSAVRPPLLVRSPGLAVRPDDPEDLVHAYLMAGRLVLERASISGRPSPLMSHVDMVCSAWASDHLQSAREVVSLRAAEQVAVCAQCVSVHEHHGRPSSCPTCGSLLIVRPLREAGDRVAVDSAA